MIGRGGRVANAMRALLRVAAARKGVRGDVRHPLTPMAVGKKGPESEADARQPAEHMAVGRILRPHGIRGELLLEAARI